MRINREQIARQLEISLTKAQKITGDYQETLDLLEHPEKAFSHNNELRQIAALIFTCGKVLKNYEVTYNSEGFSVQALDEDEEAIKTADYLINNGIGFN